MVKFSHIIFYVKDISSTIAFYKKAFDIDVRFLHESGTYAELETGSIALAFVSESLADMNLPHGYYKNNPQDLPAACEIVFTVSNVHEAFEKAAKAGASKLIEPQEKPWGQTIAYVRDPQGIFIEIASEMA